VAGAQHPRRGSLYLGEEKTDKAVPATAVYFMFSEETRITLLIARSLARDTRTKGEMEAGYLERSEHRVSRVSD